MRGSGNGVIIAEMDRLQSRFDTTMKEISILNSELS